MADITVVVPNSTFTITKPASDFTVTTPTAQVIEVGNPASTIDVTNSPVDITITEVGITNTDQLIEGTANLFFTNARADARVALGISAINYPVDSVNGQTNVVVLDTDDIGEGTSQYFTTARARASISGVGSISYNSATGVISYIGGSNPLTTDELPEGTTNLYYTTTRANNDFDSRLFTKSTSNLAEGSNLYYTSNRANNDFDTRFLTKTTSDLAEGTNLYYTTTRANTDFDSRLATKTTDNLNEGSSNQYFTMARARQAIAVSDLGGDGSLSYNSSSGVISYTGPSAGEVRAHFSGGTGVAITNGVVSIGQAVGTTDSVQFAAVQIDNIARQDTAELTTTVTTPDQVVDSWSATTYRSCKYQVQITSGTDYQVMEILVVHNGTEVNQIIYADVKTGIELAAFNVDINLGSVRLLTTPTQAVTTYKVVKTAITS